VDSSALARLLLKIVSLFHVATSGSASCPIRYPAYPKTNKAKSFPFSCISVLSTTNTMFDSPVLASQSQFASSPSDMQPSTDESMEDKNNRVENGSSTNLGVYTPTNSTINRASPDNPPLSEIISQEFPPFDAETLIIHPIMAEESEDEKFYKGIVKFAHIIQYNVN